MLGICSYLKLHCSSDGQGATFNAAFVKWQKNSVYHRSDSAVMLNGRRTVFIIGQTAL